MRKPSDALISQTLSLLPYLLQKGKVRISQAASDLRLSGKEVRQIAHLLQFCGVPPYGGGDTFDCYVERGTIRLEAARGAPLRPARLTYQEAIALAVGTHAAGQLLPSFASSAGALRNKLALAASAPPGVELPVKVTEDLRGARQRLPLFRSAIARRTVVSISYYSLNSARLSQRYVEPCKLYYYGGQWYLYAYCRTRRRDVVFRLDRVREALLTDEAFGPRTARAKEPTPHYDAPALEVDVLLPEEDARCLEERESSFLRSVEYGVGEGKARIHIVSDSVPWVVSFVLGYGGAAVVETPQRVRQAVVKAAQEILENYRRP